jgi:hypothetical protein
MRNHKSTGRSTYRRHSTITITDDHIKVCHSTIQCPYTRQPAIQEWDLVTPIMNNIMLHCCHYGIKCFSRDHSTRVVLRHLKSMEELSNWGDQLGNHAVGDGLSVPKDRDTIRFHFQNVNGVSLGKGGTWDAVCENWRHMEVDIGLVCEHKLDTFYRGVRRKLREGAERVFGMGRAAWLQVQHQSNIPKTTNQGEC